MRSIVALLMLGLLALATGNEAFARPRPRPLTGTGLVQIVPLDRSRPLEPLVLYRDPGLGRVAELPLSRLPGLEPVFANLSGQGRAVVTRQHGEWLRIIYDQADREGWLRGDRFWSYTPWPLFLKGRVIRLLPGLKKGYGVLRTEAAETAPVLAPLSPDLGLRVVQVSGDWAMVIAGISQAGWLRWRDADGRFLVGIDSRFDPQNH